MALRAIISHEARLPSQQTEWQGLGDCRSVPDNGSAFFSSLAGPHQVWDWDPLSPFYNGFRGQGYRSAKLTTLVHPYNVEATNAWSCTSSPSCSCAGETLLLLKLIAKQQKLKKKANHFVLRGIRVLLEVSQDCKYRVCIS